MQNILVLMGLCSRQKNMEKILCDRCHKEIKSNKDFIAVTQYYPKFPYSKFHTSCYSEFLKNKFWVITPKDGSGVISGKNGTRGAIIGIFLFIFSIIFFCTLVYPRIPHTTFANILVLIFFHLIISKVLLLKKL